MNQKEGEKDNLPHDSLVIIADYGRSEHITGTLNIIDETPAENQQHSRQSKAVLHLHDALGEVGWYFSQTFPTTVHYVVVAGAAGRTHGYLRNTSPRLRLNWTCRRRQIQYERNIEQRSARSTAKYEHKKDSYSIFFGGKMSSFSVTQEVTVIKGAICKNLVENDHYVNTMTSCCCTDICIN